ncbi:MAG: hypothetical protein K6T57_14630 [Thermaceae bacterium]|nr:hypothetical protein [Thermaceae bacterium]
MARPKPIVRAIKKGVSVKTKTPPRRQRARLNADEVIILKAIANHPGKTYQAYWRETRSKTGLSFDEHEEIIQKLEKRKLLNNQGNYAVSKQGKEALLEISKATQKRKFLGIF